MSRTLGRSFAAFFAAALAVMLAGGLAACTDEQPPARPGDGPPVDSRQMYEVAGDPDATVEEIVAAGRPAEIARSAAGQLLIAYLVESDDDEGPQASAWRLYEPDGTQVAEGHGIRVSEASARPDYVGLADSFLVLENAERDYQVLDATGRLTDVARVRETRTTRPGDVQLDDVSDLVFRPSSAEVFAEPRSPAGRRQQARAIDELGGAWVLDLGRRRVPVLHSRDGGSTWQRTRVRLPRDGYPLGIHPAGDLVVVPLARYQDDVERLVSLAYRDLEAPRSTPWTVVPAQVDPFSQWYSVGVSELPDGRLLVTDLDSRAYAVDVRAGTWMPLPLPDDREAGWAVESAGPLLIATQLHSMSAYGSADLGSTWEELPR